jgi:hypothetical protein
MPEKNNPGEDKAWEILATLKPEDVCTAASATYDSVNNRYRIKSFGMDFDLCVRDKTITSAAPGSEVLLETLGYFFRLSILRYLVDAKEIACTGRLIKLETMQGGDIFTKGSHVLPYNTVAQKYGKNKKGFVDRGRSLGGEIMNYGDAALQLFPLPSVPVVLILWLEDEEFPARVDLLFDSTCGLQLPTDIIWSIAMMSLLVMS